MGYYCKSFCMNFEIIYNNLGYDPIYCPFCGDEINDENHEYYDDEEEIE